MFSALHLYAMLPELKKFENKSVFGLKKTKDKIFINTGSRGIFVSIYPGKPYISIDKIKGEILLSSMLSEIKIKRIKQVDFDRILEIELENNMHIYMEITGTFANLILAQDNKILWAYRNFEKRNIFSGGIYNLPSTPGGINPLNTDRVGEKLISDEKIQGLSKRFIRFLSQIPLEDIDTFFSKISQKEIKPAVYIKETPVAVVPYPLPVKYDKKFFPRMNEAINFYYSEMIKYEEKEKEKKKRISEIDKRIKKIDMEMERLSSEKENYDDYKIMGEAILFNQSSIKKGSSEITVRNPYKKEEKLRIQIDPKMDAVKNADKYFKKYKKLKSLFLKRDKLLENLKNEKEELIQKKERIERGEFPKPEKAAGRKHKISKFRVFETKNHWTVLVGKNAKSNEELLKDANLYDIFFHIRGSPGSYTILKRMDKNKPVSHSDIEDAASIAAFFSKQKHSNLVPVSYTEVRYVRKPKKAKSGTVILTKEKVIFVKPKRG